MSLQLWARIRSVLLDVYVTRRHMKQLQLAHWRRFPTDTAELGSDCDNKQRVVTISSCNEECESHIFMMTTTKS